MTASATALRQSRAGPLGVARPTPIGLPDRKVAFDDRPHGLRLVERGRRAPRRPVAGLLAAVLVIGSLLAVVAGHAMLASGQVRLSEEQSKVVAAQASHRSMELVTAKLQTPARIVAQAEGQMHMQLPGGVTQIPSVPLGLPLPTPTLVAPSRSSASVPHA